MWFSRTTGELSFTAILYYCYQIKVPNSGNTASTGVTISGVGILNKNICDPNHEKAVNSYYGQNVSVMNRNKMGSHLRVYPLY